MEEEFSCREIYYLQIYAHVEQVSSVNARSSQHSFQNVSVSQAEV